MNARQKAKHFKKLYEESLPKKPYPVVYNSVLPRHFRIEQSISAVDMYNLQTRPHLLRTIIEDKMLQELRSLVWNNLKSEKDLRSSRYTYWLDIWFDTQESEG